MYLPVYLLPALLVHRNRLLSLDKGPVIWSKVRCIGQRHWWPSPASLVV